MSGDISRTFLVVGGDYQVSRMIRENGHHLTDDVEDADAVIFTGGADVSPFLYGEKRRPETQFDYSRDLREIKLFKNLKTTLPKIGICRGGQFLNVMSGGKMIQDVDCHAIRGTHDVRDLITGELVMCTSTHHQMMDPSDDAVIIGVAREAMNKRYERQEIKYDRELRLKTWDDIEVCYYDHNNCLCFQPHPEYVKLKDPCQEWFFELVEKYCFD